MDDYDDGPSPFGMMGMMGMAAPMMAMMFAAGFAWFVLIYVIARWRNNRAPMPDPQLGLKFALHLFRFHGYQLLLMGGTMLLFTVLMKSERGSVRGDIFRPAAAFLVAGGIVFGVHTLMLTKTNQDQYGLMGRLFAGVNLVITGLIGFVGLIFALQVLFAKGEGGNVARVAWSIVLVYCTAWGVQGALLGKSMLSGGSSDAMAPPGSMQQPPPTSVPEPMRQPLA
jgi:hypothetical protein